MAPLAEFIEEYIKQLEEHIQYHSEAAEKLAKKSDGLLSAYCCDIERTRADTLTSVQRELKKMLNSFYRGYGKEMI